MSQTSLAEDASHAVVATLTRRWPEHRIAPSLGRIAALTELLGDPQRTYPVIHLTGTNGKGSTAAMIDTAAAGGTADGPLPSPHVMSVTERITVHGEPISEDRFDEIYASSPPTSSCRLPADGRDPGASSRSSPRWRRDVRRRPGRRGDPSGVRRHLGCDQRRRWRRRRDHSIDIDHAHLLGSTVAEIADREGGDHQAGRPGHPGRAAGRGRAGLLRAVRRGRCTGPARRASSSACWSSCRRSVASCFG